MTKTKTNTNAPLNVPTDQLGRQRFLADCYKLKPKELKISELHWRSTLRAVIRGENLLLKGPSGCGKTMLAMIMPKVFNRPFFYFNMGATQDPRGALIGNVHFKKDTGTFLAQSLFVKAIQTENALILLDELSRAHPEASNILMTVLDATQRYLRIDEDPETETVKVAKGVCFVATANEGVEYTGTKTMDRALRDRFSTIIMEPLSKEDELDLLIQSCPDVDVKILTCIADIADTTRLQICDDNSKVDTIVSTRMSMRVAAQIQDGLTLEEAAEIEIYPFFSDAGGSESPMSFMKKLIQKYVADPGTSEKHTPFDPDSAFYPTNGTSNPWSPIARTLKTHSVAPPFPP